MSRPLPFRLKSFNSSVQPSKPLLTPRFVITPCVAVIRGRSRRRKRKEQEEEEEGCIDSTVEEKGCYIYCTYRDKWKVAARSILKPWFESTYCKSVQSLMIIWGNISILMGVLSSRMLTPPPAVLTEWFAEYKNHMIWISHSLDLLHNHQNSNWGNFFGKNPTETCMSMPRCTEAILLACGGSSALLIHMMRFFFFLPFVTCQ